MGALTEREKIGRGGAGNRSTPKGEVYNLDVFDTKDGCVKRNVTWASERDA